MIEDRLCLVMVRGWSVMMVGMVVFAVLVDVQRRKHGQRRDQRLSQHECDEAAHGDSLLRDDYGGTTAASWLIR